MTPQHTPPHTHLSVVWALIALMLCAACPAQTSKPIQTTPPAASSNPVDQLDTIRAQIDAEPTDAHRDALRTLSEREDIPVRQQTRALFYLSTLPSLSTAQKLQALRDLDALQPAPEDAQAAQAQRALILQRDNQLPKALTAADKLPASLPPLLLQRDRAPFALLLATSALSKDRCDRALQALDLVHSHAPNAQNFALSKAHQCAQRNPRKLQKYREDRSIFVQFFGHIASIYAELSSGSFSPSAVQPSLLFVTQHAPTFQASHIARDITLRIRAKSSTKLPIIGALLPLSGPQAPLGQRALRGLTTALASYTAASPQNAAALVLIFDTQSDPTRAQEGARTLHSQGAVALLGPVSEDDTRALHSTADSLNIPILALGIHTQPTQPSPWIFRRSLPLEQEVITQLSWMRANNLRRLSLLLPNAPLGKALQSVVQTHKDRFNVEVVSQPTFAPTTTDLRSQARSIKRSKPDAVFIAAVASKLPLVTSFLAQEDLWCDPDRSPSVICFGNSLWLEGNPLQTDPQNLQGALGAFSYTPLYRSAENDSFVRAFQHSTGTQPDFFAASAYEALRILSNSAPPSGSLSARRTALRNTLRSLKNSPGLMGNIHTTPEGILTHTPTLFRASGTSWTPIPTP